MAYDEALANRIRSILEAREDVVEKRMFGGLAFLASGHILVAASKSGALLVRVASAAERDALLSEKAVSPMIMGTKMVDRFAYVDATVVRTEQALVRWIERSSRAVAELGSAPVAPKRTKRNGKRSLADSKR